MELESEYRENNTYKINFYIKNIKKSTKLENLIYEKSLLFNDNYGGKINKYKNILYEVLYKLDEQDVSDTSDIKLFFDKIYTDISNDMFGLNEETFEKYKILQKEKDDFLDKPIDISESITECGKCKSKKTYSYTKQVRSADEGFTTFSFCFDCGHKWRIN